MSLGETNTKARAFKIFPVACVQRFNISQTYFGPKDLCWIYSNHLMSDCSPETKLSNFV